MGIDATIDDSANFKMDEALSSKIFCSVCTFILEDPVSLVCCGAHLCSKCCDDVRQSQYPNCPLCRKAYFMSTKGYLMASVLSTVRLVCENADCRVSVPYDEYEAHKKSCQEWAEKECPECKKSTSVKKAHEHLACLEKLASKLTAAEEQNRELKQENEEMKKEQPRKSKRIKIEPGTVSDAASNERRERERERADPERKAKLEKLRKILGATGGAGHFFQNDRSSRYGGRQAMLEEDVRQILKLLSMGEKKVNFKLYNDENMEAAKNGWSLRFKGSGDRLDLPCRLWIWTNDGAVRFKAVAEEINMENGDEKSRSTIKSERDGYKERIMFKCSKYFCFVRFNITIL